MGLQGLLQLDHRRHARRRRGEHREERVALRIDVAAAVRGQPRPDDPVVVAPQLVTVRWLGIVLEDPQAGAEAETLARGRQPGLAPRFARVLSRQVAADEPVTAQRRNPAQRAGCG
jgi:hypothetical protein